MKSIRKQVYIKFPLQIWIRYPKIGCYKKIIPVGENEIAIFFFLKN